MTLTKGTPTQGAILNALVAKAGRNLSVALPGTVVSYDASARTCTVRPGVHYLIPSLTNDDEDVVEELPALQDVPVCWPVARGFALASVTLAPGDPVLLIAMDRDMSAWQRTGTPQAPDDARAHSWQSCVAIPGILPDHNPIPVPSDAAALASKLDQFLRSVSLLADATNAATVITACQGILVAARAITHGGPGVPGTGTTASNVLKLGS